jgi:hypothetical protein
VALQRRVAGYHDFRMDGMTDLVLRAQGKSSSTSAATAAWSASNSPATAPNGAWLRQLRARHPGRARSVRRSAQGRQPVRDRRPDRRRGGAEAFGAKKYDITLCLATYHKLKRIMEPAELSALMQHFGKATKGYFAWRGTSDKPDENEQELYALDRRPRLRRPGAHPHLAHLGRARRRGDLGED